MVNKKLSKELQTNIKVVQIMAFILACLCVVTVIGIGWAFLFLLIIFKPTDKTFLKAGIVATIPLCLAIVPIFFVIGLWRLLRKLNAYEKSSTKTLKIDKAWQKMKWWRRYDLLVYAAAVIVLMFLLILPMPRTTSKLISIPYTTQQIQDSNLELGETQTRQPGTNGQGLEFHKITKPIFGQIFGLDVIYSAETLPTQTTQAPTNEIIASGTKKYQYMWCSNGSYRYYTNDQFSSPSVGFTHKSPDYCAQNGQGNTTGIADTAPPQTTNTVYRSTYTSPTYTHCYDTSLGYSSSFSCTSY